MILSSRCRFTVSTLVALTIVVFAFALHQADEKFRALSHLFEEMDDNHDGQVDEMEAKKYIGEQIGGHEFDSPVELTVAFHHMVTNIDKDIETPSHTISQEEVKQHLVDLQHVPFQQTTRQQRTALSFRRFRSWNGCSMDWDCRSTLRLFTRMSSQLPIFRCLSTMKAASLKRSFLLSPSLSAIPSHDPIPCRFLSDCTEIRSCGG